MLVTRSSGRPFQSTLSVRRATPENREVRSEQEISIHALREESDEWERQKKQAIMISIHALREESDFPHS